MARRSGEAGTVGKPRRRRVHVDDAGPGIRRLNRCGNAGADPARCLHQSRDGRRSGHRRDDEPGVRAFDLFDRGRLLCPLVLEHLPHAGPTGVSRARADDVDEGHRLAAHRFPSTGCGHNGGGRRRAGADERAALEPAWGLAMTVPMERLRVLRGTSAAHGLGIRRYLPSLLLAGYGAFIVSLYFRGVMTWYINPTYVF